MKIAPTMRTAGTLNAPPARIPAPYSRSHAEGIATYVRVDHSTNVRPAPAAIGAMTAVANDCDVRPLRFMPVRPAFFQIARRPTANATAAAPSHTASQRSG